MRPTNSHQTDGRTPTRRPEAERDIAIADPEFGAAERDAVAAVLDSGHVAAGSEVDAFEREWARRCETSDAVATANGTAGLHAVFEALDLDADATVVTTPFTFVATANAPRIAGYDPVFADVDRETYTLDPTAVEAVLRERDDVGAILAVHLYGLSADLPALRALADEYDVALVEDACQAHDARVADRPVGAYGDAAVFSFYPTKNMTTGEGGMVVTDDDDLAEGVRSYINHGRTESAGSYEHARVGHNFRMTDLAAAVGRVQLERLNDFTAARRENAARYDAAFVDLDVGTPSAPDDCRHVYHQYTLRVDDREGLRDHLDEWGVDTAVYYPTLVSEQPCYAGETPGYETPVARRLTDDVLSIPVHPGLSDADVDYVADAVRAFAEGER